MNATFLRGTVGHDRHVIFFLDVSAVFDVQATDFLTFRASLVRLELHAQNVTRQALHVVDGLGHLDATAFATATGVDLGFDHPNRTTELLCGLNSLLDCERWDATWDGHTKTAQDFLALVLMNLHGWSLESRL
jgi:hypothetical protein